ncbi:MAG: hypothetical protein ACYSU0_00795 [Planctomycetota bacterium]|jgi:hypothetical protein
MRSVSVWLLASAIAAGCSVPPARFGRRVGEVKRTLGEAESALTKEEFSTAVSKAKDTTRLASELVRDGKVLLGDPRREAVESALERAREIREEVTRRRERQSEDGSNRYLESRAKAALAEGAASTVVVKPPPGGAMLAGTGAAPAARTGSGAGGDVDLDRHRRIALGERKGDISEEPEVKKRKKAGKDAAPERLKIDASTPPIVIRKKPITKGKGVALYFTFVNKNAMTQIGSVTGEFLRETGNVAGHITSAYKAKGFKPNWEDIFESEGEAVTAGSIGVLQMEGIQLVCICEKPSVGKVTSARIVVTTLDGMVVRGKGPKTE